MPEDATINLDSATKQLWALSPQRRQSVSNVGSNTGGDAVVIHTWSSADAVEEPRVVAMRTFEPQVIVRGSNRLVPTRRIIFVARRSFEGEGLLEIVNPSLGIDVVAESEAELEQGLEDQLWFLWSSYGSDQVSPDDLTDAAKALRNRLRDLFRQEAGA